jgi:transcriptional regulator with XRE-family HTH domain
MDTATAPRRATGPFAAARGSTTLIRGDRPVSRRPRGDGATRRAFARFLGTARTRVGLSQERLAELLYVSDRTVRNWELAATLPHPRHLPALIDALVLTPSEQRAAFLLVAGYECECAPASEREHPRWVELAASCTSPAAVLAPDWRVLAVNGPLAALLPALAPGANVITVTFGDRSHIARLGTRRQFLEHWTAPLAGRLLGDLAAPGRRALIEPLIRSALALPEFSSQWRSTRWAAARVSSDGQVRSVLDPHTGRPRLHRLAAETFAAWPGVTLVQLAPLRCPHPPQHATGP